MAGQVIKVMCGKCGHRRLAEYRVDANWKATNKKPAAHISVEPSGRIDPALLRTQLQDSTVAEYISQSQSRVTFKCHRRCGNDVPVRFEKLQSALQKALESHRQAIWLPNDL